MALIIETGSGASDSQSYATTTELTAYAQLRAASVPTRQSELEALLIKAMDYLEGQNFVGDKLTETQALQWPRCNVVIENFPLASNAIPRQLVQAQCALAIEAQTVDLLPTTTVDQKGPVIKERIEGAIEIAYANTGKVRNVPAIAKAQALLSVLLKRGGLGVVGERI